MQLRPLPNQPGLARRQRTLERTGADQQRGEWVDPSLGRVTFGEWADAWSETIVDLRPATVDQNLRLLRLYALPVFGDVALGKITPLDVRRWLARLMADPRLLPSTVRKIGQVFRKVMNAAVDSGFIVRSPARGVKLRL